MEIWSEFIHEELFILGKSPELQTTDSAILGIIAINTLPEDEELLEGILKATKLNPQLIIRSEEMNASAKTWLVFKEYWEINGKVHSPLKKFTENSETIILAYPLSRLRSSQREKAELWGILKVYFNL
jgi:hypothetical protein